MVVVAPAHLFIASPSFGVDLNRTDEDDYVALENRSFRQLAVEMASSPVMISDCTFSLCIEAFRHCKPLVSIDDTHLYGKYGGTLLLAIAQDGNSNILSAAFTLVEGENVESWHNCIKTVLKALDSSWLPPRTYQAFYIHHVAANFLLSFRGQDAKRLLLNAAYEKTEVKFDYWFDIM
ncbi:uncharacterized protein LOC107634017 [Arachis ipaensis]|uniref:uncharacterized protein LOC107634017 n=1 Tax=Arachis ipaensis TaxID=130454 RepID=UPI0007AFD666|nr:uncharacterized protein LOC107634017 [Arachis ipaensis]XP_025640957.1 uncharacterized protein LOC112735645 [Arachis hypogaea]